MRLPRLRCADERGEAYGEVGLEAFGDGEQRGVAPDVGWAGGDGFAGEDAADGFEVVGDFERGEAVGAGGEGLVAETSCRTRCTSARTGYRNSSSGSLRVEKSDELFDFLSLEGRREEG